MEKMTSLETSEIKPEKTSSSEPTSYLLSKYGLMFLGIVLLLAAWFNQIAVVILLGLVLSAIGIAKLWSRLSLAGVSCQRIFSELRAFPDEYIEMKLRVENRKPLPLPWLRVNVEMPMQFISTLPLLPSDKPDFGILSNTASLRWYSAISWRYRLYCQKRGYYRLGPMTVTSGDIFGLYPRSITQPSVDHIIVYPKIFSIGELGITPLYLLGDAKAEKRIFEDPARIAGIRDYTPYDNPRHIHWKATARHQQLQLKIFESTTLLKVAIFLPVESFQSEEGIDEEDFELGISTAASIANYCIKQDIPAGLFVNSQLVASGQPIRIPSASTMGQLLNILEALAKVTPLPGDSFECFFEGERSNLPWGTTFIFILSKLSEHFSKLLINLKDSGHKLSVLQVGDNIKERPEHMAIWHQIKNMG